MIKYVTVKGFSGFSKFLTKNFDKTVVNYQHTVTKIKIYDWR